MDTITRCPKHDALFVEQYTEIARIVENYRSKWTFKATVMRDFDDVKSEIITHIWEKWYQYDTARPLGGWVATITHNQFTNILRNIYLSTSSPCVQCRSNLGDGMCALFGTQGAECGAYAKWERKKKSAHHIRLPLALENHIDEAVSRSSSSQDLEPKIEAMHKKLEAKLTSREWQIYKKIFVENKPYDEVAKEMGFKTTETGRKGGYKRIRQIEVVALEKAREIIKECGVEGLE